MGDKTMIQDPPSRDDLARMLDDQAFADAQHPYDIDAIIQTDRVRTAYKTADQLLAYFGRQQDATLADPTPAPSGDDVAKLRAENERLKEQAHDLGNRAVGAEARAETAEAERDALRANRDALAHGEKAALQQYGTERLRADAAEGQVKRLAKRIHNQRAALRRDWQIQESRCPQSRIRLDVVRGAIAARHAAEARCKAMEEALTKIRDMDWVENCLDPQWPASVARASLSQHQKGEGHE